MGMVQHNPARENTSLTILIVTFNNIFRHKLIDNSTYL